MMAGPFENITILIVDDSLSMRRIIRKFFENSGGTLIREAGDGRAALEILETWPADLVVSDLNMPRMNGLELLDAVRQREAGAGRSCFVMLTVEAIQKTMNKALEKGADSYIVKPVTEKVFIEEVLAALERCYPSG